MPNGFVRAVLATLLTAGAAAAADPLDTLVRRSYPVADLIAPWPPPMAEPPFGVFRPVTPPQAAPTPAVAQVQAVAPVLAPAQPGVMPENADKLIRLVTMYVMPYSWDCLGGPGSIAFDRTQGSLVVCNTPAAQRDVEELITAFRRLQEKSAGSVSLEVRVVEAPDVLFERLGADFDQAIKPVEGKPPVVFLSDKEVRYFLEAAQGDRRVNITQAPKMTAWGGQPITCRVGETMVFQTGLELAAGPDGVVRNPRFEAIDVGTRIAATSTVSADRRSIGVKFRFETAAVNEATPVTPVVVAAGGPEPGKTAPDVLARPAVNRQVVVADLAIPDGGTALLAGPAVTRETRTEFGPPVLSNIPYASRLFRNQGICRETKRQLVLVTARVIKDKEEAGVCDCQAEKAAEACKTCPSLEAAKLVAAYRKACAEGKTEEAMKLAMQALATDPKCFAAGK